jgi:hypothetical protein
MCFLRPACGFAWLDPILNRSSTGPAPIISCSGVLLEKMKENEHFSEKALSRG